MLLETSEHFNSKILAFGHGDGNLPLRSCIAIHVTVSSR